MLYQEVIGVNTQEANNITDLAFSLYDYEEVFHHIFADILYQIGDEWEKGNITVAQEHFASQFIINRCTQFLRILPVNPNLPKILAFCPEGEDHHIGLMLFSLFLRRKGNEVIYLGSNTPLDGLSTLIENKKISNISISITNPAHLVRVEKWIEAYLVTNPHLKFVIGGKGIQKSQRTDTKSVSYLTHLEWESFYETNFI